MIKRAAIYSRVSTSLGRQKTDRQVEDLIKYVKSMGFEIDTEDIYEEYASGYKSWLEREEFKRLKDKIDSDTNYYTGIFVWEISRIARDPDQGNAILTYLSSKKLCVYVKEPMLRSINSKGERDGMFNIYFTILTEFANTEALLIKKRSRSGIRSKILEQKGAGYVVLPYGYERENGTKLLLINEAEKVVVDEIFNLCLQGHGTKTIANILNGKKIPTRYNKSKKKSITYSNGKPPIENENIKWKDGTVYGILTNTTYKGKRKVKSNPDDFEDGLVPENSFDYYDVPAIISEETWELAQDKLKSNLKHSIRNTKFLYILKDKIKCSYCGGSYFGRFKTDGKDKFYMCSSKRTLSRICTNKGYSIEFLEGLVWELVINSTKADDIEKLDSENSTKKKKKSDLELLIEELNRELKASEKSLLDAKIMYLENPKKFEEAFNLLDRKHSGNIRVLRKKISDTRAELSSLSTEVVSYDEAKQKMKKLTRIKQNRNEIKSLVNVIVSRVFLYSFGDNYIFFTIEYNFRGAYGKICADYLLNRKLKSYSPIKKIGKIGSELEYDEYGRIISNSNLLMQLIEDPQRIYKPIKPLLFKTET
jgi:site-specific DNA recombinase